MKYLFWFINQHIKKTLIFAMSKQNRILKTKINIMKLTVENLSEITGIQISDIDGVLNEWKDVEIENVDVQKNGVYTNITFKVVKAIVPFNSYQFGGQVLTLTLENNEIYDF